MIKELMHDPIFLAGKSEVAMKEDLQVAQDLLDTLMAHNESCVGMAANMIGVIAIIKLGNVIFGFVRTKKLISPHTVLNKVTGLLLFLLPVTISFVDITYTLLIVCTVATVAAIHEVYVCGEIAGVCR